jgi:hypothetical protein
MLILILTLMLALPFSFNLPIYLPTYTLDLN